MNNVRWSIVVRDEVDRASRSYLARRGTKKGDLSRFVGCLATRNYVDTSSLSKREILLMACGIRQLFWVTCRKWTRLQIPMTIRC